MMEYTPGKWFKATSIDEMQEFYMSRLPAIRSAARDHGYALGLHGSTRRDLDLMAMPWSDECSDPDTLAKALQHAACGISADKIFWEVKPNGRIATSMCICWTDHSEQFDGMLSVGHIDLSMLADYSTVENILRVGKLVQTSEDLLSRLHAGRAIPFDYQRLIDDVAE